MNTVTTATVETLTAEVRVLMVGSRQVTLSVYNQIDQVKYGKIDPFGRVAPRNADPDYVYVVGASTRDADRGSLVRSRYWVVAKWHRQANECRRMLPAARERDTLEQKLADQDFPRGREWEVRDSIRQANLEMRGYRGWTLEELELAIHEDADRAEEAAQWEALPLIVLAGLR